MGSSGGAGKNENDGGRFVALPWMWQGKREKEGLGKGKARKTGKGHSKEKAQKLFLSAGAGGVRRI